MRSPGEQLCAGAGVGVQQENAARRLVLIQNVFLIRGPVCWLSAVPAETSRRPSGSGHHLNFAGVARVFENDALPVAADNRMNLRYRTHCEYFFSSRFEVPDPHVRI